MLAQLFGKKQKDPREQVREWQSNLRKEMRVIDRQIFDIQREEAKVKSAVKDAAKRGDVASAKVLAKVLNSILSFIESDSTIYIYIYIYI